MSELNPTATEMAAFESQAHAKEAAIEALVDIAQEAPNAAAFYQRVVPVLGRCLGCAFVQLEIRSGSTVLSEIWSHSESAPEFWAQTAESLMTDTMAEGKTFARIFEGKSVDVKAAFLCSTVGVHGRRGGGLVAVMPCRTSSDVDEKLELLDVLCTLASSLVDSVGSAKQSVGIEGGSREASQGEVGRVRKVAEFTSETELAFAITNKLRTRDGSEQVVLSAVDGYKVKMLSISGTDTIAPRSPGVKLVLGAAQESVDLRQAVVDQDQDMDGGDMFVTGGRLHRSWRESVGGGCVASIPVFEEDQIVAVLSVRRKSSQPFNAEELAEMKGLVEPYAKGLEMVRSASRSLKDHLVSSAKNAADVYLQPGSHGRKAVTITLAVLAAWMFFGSLSYSVQAPCELVPARSRQIAAASDGRLAASYALPGDTVKKGDLLCEFDTTELELERAQLQGELAVLDVDRFGALDNGSPAELELATANARAVRANLALTEYRILGSAVYATTDGVVLEGDHRSRIGDAFSKGEPLYRIAPRDGWTLEVRVPEADISMVEAGMSGEFACYSRPEKSFAFEVVRLSPSAESKEGNNFFSVEADLALPVQWARSGMEGFASIDVGDRAPAWILFHRLVDFARLNLWL